MGPPRKTLNRGPIAGVLVESANVGQSKVLRTAEALENSHPVEAQSVKERVTKARASLGLSARLSEGGAILSEGLQTAAEPSALHPVEPRMVLSGEAVSAGIKSPVKEKRRDKRISKASEAARETVESDDVAPRELRRELRESLQARLEAIKADMDAARKERDFALERIRALNKEKASPAKTALETPQARRDRIDAELEAARDELHAADVGRELAVDYIRTLRLLDATERDYYLALTSAAARTEEYQKVAKGSSVSYGSSSGDLTVDHIFPRSKIFLLPGFERIDWPTQVAMFAFSKNLRLIEAAANSSRRATPYAKLPNEFRRRFDLTTQMQAELAKLEDYMEQYFSVWVSTRRQPEWRL